MSVLPGRVGCWRSDDGASDASGVVASANECEDALEQADGLGPRPDRGQCGDPRAPASGALRLSPPARVARARQLSFHSEVSGSASRSRAPRTQRPKSLSSSATLGSTPVSTTPTVCAGLVLTTAYGTLMPS